VDAKRGPRASRRKLDSGAYGSYAAPDGHFLSGCANSWVCKTLVEKKASDVPNTKNRGLLTSATYPGEDPMATTYAGGCACGAIRYECSADAPQSFNCHCRDCQRATGSAYTSFLVVPSGTLKLIRGNPKFHSVRADSGHTTSRGFCPDCGSPLLGKITEVPEIMVILAGSLDDPSWHRPAADFYTSSAQPWDFMNPALAKFEKEPEQ
jgi:hypothetical protein